MWKRILAKVYDAAFRLMMRVLSVYEWIANAVFSVALAVHDWIELAATRPPHPADRLCAYRDPVWEAMQQAKATIRSGECRDLAGDELVYVRSDPEMRGDGAGI